VAKEKINKIGNLLIFPEKKCCDTKYSLFSLVFCFFFSFWKKFTPKKKHADSNILKILVYVILRNSKKAEQIIEMKVIRV
jgi:hypothetical protein